jgi:hypothetical protein
VDVLLLHSALGAASLMDWIWYILIAAGFALGFYFDARRRGFIFSRPQAHKFHQSRLVGVLLGLEDKAVGKLLELYKKEFGTGPARYARKTLRKWKAGEVQPATQTYERFLVHLPRVMSYDMKCDVLRHFMEEYSARDHIELELYTDEWEAKLEPAVRQLVDKAFTAELPGAVERQLTWLGDGDMQAAKEILKHSQAEEGRIMVSMLRDEFAAIEKLLAEEHLKPKVTHVLKFPYGKITLYVRKRV